MTAKILIAAAALAIAAGTLPAKAASITSDPEATMTEQQKLGPNERTTQHSNAFVTRRHGSASGRVIVPSYGSYSQYRSPGYLYDDAQDYSGYVYGYHGSPRNVW